MDGGTSAYEKIIAQCKSNDVDARVEALSKLQAHFSKGAIEVTDSEALINILKASLRTSNLHLTNAALSALPTILPSLITRPTHAAQFPSNTPLVVSSTTSSASSAFDVTVLRSALGAFLPTGGVIDRLGDKERAQAKARETLVLLGGYAFRAGGSGTMSTKLGKGQETPLSLFERIFKEGGLGSRVWKVREQAILTLVHLRRAHHLFPIRPYLSYLVDCLEDTDAHVRDCARQSVVELFTGPAVSDAARADLKKEMAKKSVRKAIVDDVLAKLLSKVSNGSNPQSHEGSENGESNGDKDYLPPSLALQGKRPRVLSHFSAIATTQPAPKEMPRASSRAAMSSPPPPITPSVENVDVMAVYIASTRDLDEEFAAMQKPFEGKETEHNWAAREHAIQLVRGMLKGDVHNRYFEHFLNCLKDGFIQCSLKTLASLRTTVAVNTCLLYTELAIALGPQLDPLCDILFTNLLKMSGFTKKITAQQSQSAITTIISHASPQPRLVVPLLWAILQEKNVQSRSFGVTHFKHYLETQDQRSKHAIEVSGHLDTIEKAVKKSLADPNPGVRELARSLFWVFARVWKERGSVISNTLDPNALKQLEKACPSPDLHVPLPSTPGGSKKSSVAAAIAASRAKAKAIATAPPTLRHRATSTPRHESSPTPLPKSVTAPRSRSPLRASTSPPSPTLARFAFTRSTSAGVVPSSPALHTRTFSGSSETNSRAVSPSSSDGAHQRTSASSATNISTRRSITKILADSIPPTDHQASQAMHGRSGAPIPAGPSVAPILTTEDDSLLMAQSVPVPEDSDSEDDAINVLSFSAVMQQMSPQKNALNSPAFSLSPASDSRPSASVSNTLLSLAAMDIDRTQQPIVEDALRARAEQAESAAERLLELVEPEDDLPNHPTLPLSLLKTTNEYKSVPSKLKAKPAPAPIHTVTTQTPDSRANVILKKAALFADSPMMRNSKQTSLLDVLRNSRHETGWWLKRKALSAQASPLKAPPPSARVHDLQDIIATLEDNIADVAALKQLAIICMENPTEGSSEPHLSSSPISPISKRSQMSHTELWETNQAFEKLFKALMAYLQPSKTEDELAYGLIVIWEALENQPIYLDGKESEVFSAILRVRYCNKITVLEGTNAIRDTLTSKLDPVYGLTTVHANLKVFHAQPPPSLEDEEIKAATYAFGLMALGKFILRLPAEIAEEELPRLKGTLTTSLNDRSSLIVRESAAAAITAAQLVLRDETHLFTLLDGLTDEKKNLLTYLFDKHGARSPPSINRSGGMEKLERELRRLDTRTSTPLRGSN